MQNGVKCKYLLKRGPLEPFSKGQFCKNTVYLERGRPYFFGFMSTDAVLVKKNKNIILDLPNYAF